MLEAKDINLTYGDHAVIKKLSGEFQPGYITGILGKNGTGKSTFFKSLAGIKALNQGKFIWNNEPYSPALSAYLETHPKYLPYMTGKEFLILCGITSDMITQWNTVFKLPLNQYANSYSTGMKKKLSFIATVGQDTPIVLLDEPFNGLDLQSSEVLFVILEELKKANKCILLSSHLLDGLLRCCDSIYQLEDGKFCRHYEKSNFEELKAFLLTSFKAETTIPMNLFTK